MVQEAVRKSATLIEALPYIKAFAGRIVVVKLGGSAQDDDDVLRKIFTDLDFMMTVGMRPVVVHGGGKSITRAMESSGIPARFVHGQRVTCARTLEIAASVLIDEVGTHLLRLLHEVGREAAPLNGRDHRFLKAIRKRLPAHPEEDLGFVGEPVAIDASDVYELLGNGIIPVIAPIASGVAEEYDVLFNVNGDTAAALIARELHAEKLVFFLDTDGLYADASDRTSLVSHADKARVEAMIASGAIGGGMIPKVEAALYALAGGVHKAHIVSGAQPHALLLEMFTPEGVGTEIVL